MIKYVGGAIFFFCAAVVLVWLLSHRPATSGNVPQGIQAYDSGILGVVKTGPTCPVQRAGDTSCDDKPYATTVTVSRVGSTAVFATVDTGADGAYHFALPPGAYVVSASGGNPFPRCGEESVTVQPTGYVNADIHCDTGIR